MSNPLFNMFGNQLPRNMGNFMNMLQQFDQFRRSFQGDPRQQVQELLNSGQMSQSQFNQLQAMATQFQKIMNR